MDDVAPNAVQDLPDNALLSRQDAAQLLDNFGCLTATTKTRKHADGKLHKHYLARYRLVTTDLDYVGWLQRQFGGSICRHGDRHFAFELSETALAGLLEEVAGYMGAKRRQADLILQLVEVKENGNDRESQRGIVEELRCVTRNNVGQ